jgi:hypothetical protein
MGNSSFPDIARLADPDSSSMAFPGSQCQTSASTISLDLSTFCPHFFLSLNLSIKETFAKMITESELRRRFLHTIFLVGKKKLMHIPARHGNTFTETPIDLSLVMEKILLHEKT